MAYEHLCMYCFEDLQGQVVCPHCGRDSRAAVPQIQMLPGSLVYHDRFLVGRALGQDATGIVYAAFDTKRENKMRLREYLPRDCAERLNDGSVVPAAGREDAFDKGMRKLRASVEGVEDPKKRHFYFEENGTAYIAQRKSAAVAAASDEDDENGSGFKQIGVIIGIAAAVVIVAAIVIVSLVNGALRSSTDVVQNATLAPNATTNFWAPEVTASPTPYVSPTFAALVDPEQSWMDYTYSGDVNKEFNQQVQQASTPKPSLKDFVDDEYETVGKNSDTAEVTTLQQRLASLGWLSAEKITGKYDADTKQAVKDFQTYVNNTFQPAEKLSVDGVAGPKTQQWLYATEAIKPTPTPTPAVTPDPSDTTVDKDSSKTDVKAVQRKLIVLGLMEAGGDDGVYGTTTVAAVKKFQQRVNQLQGYEVLPVSGIVDPDTMAYLNYYVEWWESLQQATATPDPVLPTFTPEPTAAPTDIPDQEEDNFRVDKDSPKESVQYVQQMLIAAGLLPEGSDDGSYGAATEAAMLAFQMYVNDYFQGDRVPEDGIGDAVTLSYLEEFVYRGMTVPKDDPTAEPTAEPTEAPTTEPTAEPTEAPTTEPTAGPTEAPTTEPTAEPETGVTPESSKEEIKHVQQLLMAAGLLGEGSDDGDYGRGTTNAVLAFQQYVNDYFQDAVLDENGIADADTMMYLEEFVSRGLTVPTQAPTQAPTDAPTQTPTEEPTSEPTQEPTAAPDVQLTLNVGGTELVNGVHVVNEVSVIFSWSADMPVSDYYIYVYDSNGGVFYQEEATGRASGVFSAGKLAPGELYTIRVGARPVGGDESSMAWAEAQFMVPAPEATAEPTQAPTEAPTQAPTEAPTQAPDAGVTPDSSKEAIKHVQQLLISAGLLNNGSDDGDYGKGTTNAVAAFQQYVNEFFGEQRLDVTGIADADTMKYLEEFVNRGMTVPKDEPTQAPTAEPTEVPAEPTQAPTEAPTQAPDAGVTPDSSKEAIKHVQQLLISAGLLNNGSDDGDYGKGTTNAVAAFQQYVNEFFGEQRLDVTGIADADTMKYLEEFVNRGMTVPKDEPTQAPTAEPTEVPAEPTEAPEPTAAPKPVVSINNAVYDPKDYTDERLVIDPSVPTLFSWECDADLKGYMLQMTNSVQQQKDLGKTTENFIELDLSTLSAGDYVLWLGAVPSDAQSEVDVVWTPIPFTIPEAN